MAPGETDVDEGPPLRTLRLANKLQAGLVRKSVALPGIAGDARANDVLPRGLTAAISRKDVIQVQFVAFKNLATILAGVPITLEDIVSGKLDLFFRQAFKEQQHDDSRDANAHRNRSNHLRFGIDLGKVAPTREVMRQIVVRPVGGDNLGVSLVQEREGSSHRTGVHRLPKTVQDKNWLVQDAFHFAFALQANSHVAEILRAS